MAAQDSRQGRIDLSTLLPPHDLTTSAARDFVAMMRDRGHEIDPTKHRVFATRSVAQAVAELLPPGRVVLDCSAVEVTSPPFVHELLKLRPDVSPDGLNEDCAEAWAMAAPGYEDGPA